MLNITTKKPVSLDIGINETSKTSFVIKCIVSSSPPANISFTRLGQTLTPLNESVTITTEGQDGGNVTHVLTLVNATVRDVAEYHCSASNGFLSKTLKAGVINLAGLCSASFKTKNQASKINDKKYHRRSEFLLNWHQNSMLYRQNHASPYYLLRNFAVRKRKNPVGSQR